ncbi:MAG: acyl-CoA dehydrogenase [Alphaproteobacteria bacterium]|nr:acyl-CoA dehydrogenase [Alphaproteobacteria bacterium]
MRLFGDHVSPQIIAAAETGTWPDALWSSVTEAGYLDVLGDGAEGMSEAATILRAAGYHAAPIPLPETMLARWLCAAAGLEAPDGPLTIAPVEPTDQLALFGNSISGSAAYVPWAESAEAIALVGSGSVGLGHAALVEPGKNLAGEPRGRLTDAAVSASAPMPNSIGAEQVLSLGALMRAAQMAGAMEAALDLTTQYANDRVQFGRPIGKFQGIQHQIALLAEEVAASLVAVESAAARVAASHPMADTAVAAAKIRTGEAAGKVADYAHQVHGAIGFTKEHSLHHLTRRLWSWRDEFGDEAYWAARLGRRVAAAGPAGLWPLLTAS